MSSSPRTLIVAFGIATLALATLAGCAPASSLPQAGQTDVPATSTSTQSPAASTASPTPSPLSTSSAAPAAAAAAPSGTAASLPAPPPPPPPGPSIPNCSSASFHTGYVPLTGTAGKEHGELVFKNISGAECQTNGYPRAQFETAVGSVEGPEAVDDGPVIGTELQIAKNGSIFAPITFTDGSLIEICEITSVTHLAVIPPGGQTWVDVAIPEWNACENGTLALISVGLIQPG